MPFQYGQYGQYGQPNPSQQRQAAPPQQSQQRQQNQAAPPQQSQQRQQNQQRQAAPPQSRGIICAVNGKNKVVDFRSNLMRANPDDYAEVHGRGGSKHAPASSIAVVLCDYSNGTGPGKSRTVRFNLSVTDFLDIRYNTVLHEPGRLNPLDSMHAYADLAKARSVLLAGAKDGLPAQKVIEAGKSVSSALDILTKTVTPGEPDWTFSAMSINIHKKVDGGRHPAGYLTISHMPIRKNGDEQLYPWYIHIKSGTALNRYQDGKTAISNFQKEQEAYINISEKDYRNTIESIYRFIKLWEMGVALPQLKKAEEIRLSQRLDWMSRNK